MARRGVRKERIPAEAQRLPSVGLANGDHSWRPVLGLQQAVWPEGPVQSQEIDETFVEKTNKIHEGEEFREGEAEEKAQAARDAMLSKGTDMSQLDHAAMMRIIEGVAGVEAAHDEDCDSDDERDRKADESVEVYNPLKACSSELVTPMSPTPPKAIRCQFYSSIMRQPFPFRIALCC